jgi:fatty-acyl-CoA synthase
VTGPHTVTAMLGARARERPDGLALVLHDRRLTFAELEDHAARVASGLARLGVGVGDRVAVWLPNCLAWVELEFALARLGAIAIAINTKFRAEEVGDILERSEARVLVLWPGFKDIDFTGILTGVDADRLAGLETLVTVDATAADASAVALRDVRAVGYDDLLAHDPMDDDHARPDATCNAFTSSGTTGAPKLVLHAQQGIAVHSDAVAGGFGYREPDCVVLGMLPFCGVFGFNTVMGALAAGAPSVLMPVFEAGAAVELIERERVTNTNGSDEMLRRILAEAQPPERVATLREAGFAAFSGDARTLIDAADALGKRFYMAYGSSEVQALLAHQPADAPPEVRARAGGPPVHPDTDVRVRATEEGDDSLEPPGESGELEIRGPSVMTGYLGDDEAAREAFTDDGYLRSGDLGSLAEREGFVYLTRQGDVLRLGGFLVSPVEIEDFLEKLEPVSAAQVVGVDTPSGAQPVAFVIPGPDQDIDEEWIIGRCAADLAKFKVPRRVICVDAFPTTPSANGERVQRQVLRRRAAELIEEA